MHLSFSARFVLLIEEMDFNLMSMFAFISILLSIMVINLVDCIREKLSTELNWYHIVHYIRVISYPVKYNYIVLSSFIIEKVAQHISVELFFAQPDCHSFGFFLSILA
jgi:hypothetical protein